MGSASNRIPGRGKRKEKKKNHITEENGPKLRKAKVFRVKRVYQWQSRIN